MHFRIGKLRLEWERDVMSRSLSLRVLYSCLRESHYSQLDARTAQQIVERHSLGPQSEPLEAVLERTYNLQRASIRLRNSLTLNFTVQEDLDRMVVGWIERLMYLGVTEGPAILLASSAYQAAMEFRISFGQITELLNSLRYTIMQLPLPNPDVEPVFWITPPYRLEPILPVDRRAANQAARIAYVWQDHLADQSPAPVTADAT